MAHACKTHARSALLSALLLLAGSAGCSQDKGEPCQVDRDCADGLECVIARGSQRGTCEDPAEVGDDDGNGGSGDGGGPLPSELDAAADTDAAMPGGDAAASDPDAATSDDAGSDGDDDDAG